MSFEAKKTTEAVTRPYVISRAPPLALLGGFRLNWYRSHQRVCSFTFDRLIAEY